MVPSLNRTLIKKKDFRDWLKSKAPDDIVGQSNSPRSCPIAQYLRLEFAWVQVGEHGIHVETFENKHYSETSKPWIDRFTLRVDSAPNTNTPVTAKDALRILNNS